jgi:hypothetical protein
MTRLTEYQMSMLRHAAAALPGHERDGFYRAVVAKLRGEPSNAAVTEAINLALDARASWEVFLCDSASVTKEEERS